MEVLSHGCTLDCFDCCKFNIHVENNEILKITGDKSHPFTKGFVCKKGLAHLDRLHHKDRVYNPMLKVDGEWKEISFEEALLLMAEKLNLYKEKYSSKSILYYEQYGNGALLKSMGDLFFNFFGGVSKSKGGPCWSAGIKAQTLNFGDVRSHSLEDMFNSKSIFVWGKNPAFTSIHTMQSIKKAKANGSKIVVIDPIYTKTAEIADKYVRVKPNGDGALALAMGKVIIERDLYDKNYLSDYVNGFEEYKNYVATLKLEDLIEASGVSKDDIEELVDLYTNKYSTILLGYGMQKYKNGGNTISLVDILGAITGQIGFSGGGINYANKVYPNVINSDPYNSEEGCENRFFYVSEMADFINDSLEGKDYYDDENIYIKENNSKSKLRKFDVPIKMAVVTKSNLLNQLANLNELKDAFSKVEFKVCFDMFMTDTAKECDLFIPTTSTLESEDLIYSSMTNPYIIYNEKAVEPKNKFMDEYEFFKEAARILNMKKYPYVDKYNYITKVIAPLKKYNDEISIEYLKNNHFTIHNSIAWEDKKFETDSGKFEIFFNDKLYKENNYNNEFTLLTNHTRDSLSSQHIMDKEGIAVAYINENMAKELKLSNDEIVILKNKNGEITVKLNIDNMVADFVVLMYVGWWAKHGNPNFLTESGISDIGGQVTYNETKVEIIKK
ncbi:molybdopterin-dependent oxidoreductase [Clostridium sp. AL.422]|uniref:molybdopterin-dependent oxidoreductase n=1 Tax=Clostridium TaxID=1485 RepID=UPI00293DEE35|nr:MULTISPECIES: molybdopterin-dependent oxidoreductase [unclassified Clostridium]MDV4150995.1 molybdopterin-dependent oxidoreductase [Clostridium sp. AL.422]